MENYFNYFTEIEECFRKCRGTPTRLSTLDWALIESWKEAGVPLKAVLIGIGRAFQKFARRPQRFRRVNGLAYCTQEVLGAAEELKAAVAEGGEQPQSRAAARPPFGNDELRNYLLHGAQAVEDASHGAVQNGAAVLATDLREAATELRAIASQRDVTANLEELESRLSALEDRLTASLTRAAPVELLADFRREVDKGLIGCRHKMTGPQIESLQRQLVKKRLLGRYQIPRLSLFYFL